MPHPGARRNRPIVDDTWYRSRRASLTGAFLRGMIAFHSRGRMAFQAVVIRPRCWLAWVAFAGTYAAVVLSDTLGGGRTGVLPHTALLAMSCIVPTMWPADALGSEDDSVTGACARLAGGLGFLVIAAPIWCLAARPVAVWATAELALWAFLGAWVWSGIASALSRHRTVSLISVFVVVAPALVIGRPETATSAVARYVSTVSGPAAYGMESPGRWIHPALSIAVGTLVWLGLSGATALGRHRVATAHRVAAK